MINYFIIFNIMQKNTLYAHKMRWLEGRMGRWRNEESEEGSKKWPKVSRKVEEQKGV